MALFPALLRQGRAGSQEHHRHSLANSCLSLTVTRLVTGTQDTAPAWI